MAATGRRNASENPAGIETPQLTLGHTLLCAAQMGRNASENPAGIETYVLRYHLSGLLVATHQKTQQGLKRLMVKT